ncbi:MAG: prephenate dehydratase [Candidatus Goldbacteria bacterium]|nr:prephenate dehydratase [Candidatus Goldiibacteriota bacterium]
MNDEIKKCRKQIDAIDKKIVELLHKRAKNVLKIASIKQKEKVKIYDPARESTILKKIKKGAFPEVAIKNVFNEIFSASRYLQKKVYVAYLGPVASFCHMAAMKRFGKMTQYLPFNSIKDVFMEVEKGNADYGCVPIENSTEGAVNYTYDMFVDSDLKICSEIILDINHCLLSKEKNIKNITQIFSHPQSFAQCRNWLESNLPGVKLIEVSSNSKGAELATKTAKSAAIAGELAASTYGLNILATNIQDMADNVTRFFIIGNQLNKKTSEDKTSIMVSIKDKVGALYSLLRPFQKYGINLTNIESRPSKKKAWDYLFFVDFQGHLDEKKVCKALEEVKKECGAIKILGSYPKF